MKNNYSKSSGKLKEVIFNITFILCIFILILCVIECGILLCRRGPMGLVRGVFTRPSEFQYQPYELWISPPNLRKPGVTIGPDGFRIVPYNAAPTDNAQKVFLFGGSTMWGVRVNDRQTIAFYLARELGPAYRVLNLGERGFNSVQEFNRLMRLIAEGNVPDIVVFYDGANDTWDGVYSPAIPRWHHYLNEFEQGVFEGNIFLAPLKKTNLYFLSQWLQRKTHVWDANVAKMINHNAPRVLDMWLENNRMAQAVGDRYGIKIYFAWQPIIFSGKKPLDSQEKAIVEKESVVLKRGFQKVYQLAGERFPRMNLAKYPPVQDLTDVFNQEPEPIYLDFCHVNARGNELIARRFARIIRGD